MALAGDLKRLLPPDAVIEEPEQLRTYECDGLTGHRVVPSLVALPTTTEEVQAVVRACAAAGVPFVARGAGTGLSGGALPVADGVVISLARMNRVLEVDLDGGADRGAARGDEPAGDRGGERPTAGTTRPTRPASRSARSAATSPRTRAARTASSTGSRRTTSPGCSSCSPTARPSGSAERSSRRAPTCSARSSARRGRSGSRPRSRCACCAGPRRCARCSPRSTRPTMRARPCRGSSPRGIQASAMEIMDRLTIEAAEAAVHPGYPDANALLLVELDGPAPQVEEDLAAVEAICAERGAWEIRTAADDHERALLWKGRKSAFAAMGRVSPDYYVQDGVVPRTKLPEVLRRIDELSAEYGLRVGNVFHAGDGNLHPLVLYDGAIEGQADAGAAAGGGDPRGVHRRGRLADRRARDRRRQGVLDAAALRRRRPRGDAAAARRRSTRPGCATRGSSSRRRGCAARCRGRTAPTRSRRPGLPSVSEIWSRARGRRGARRRGGARRARLDRARRAATSRSRRAGSTRCSSTRRAT